MREFAYLIEDMELVALFEAKNDQPTVRRWRVITDVGKIRIQGDQASLFTRTDFDYLAVWGSDYRFLKDRVRVVACRSQIGGCLTRKIFVSFELQAAASSGSRRLRSRANSAAYAIAA